MLGHECPATVSPWRGVVRTDLQSSIWLSINVSLSLSLPLSLFRPLENEKKFLFAAPLAEPHMWARVFHKHPDSPWCQNGRLRPRRNRYVLFITVNAVLLSMQKNPVRKKILFAAPGAREAVSKKREKEKFYWQSRSDWEPEMCCWLVFSLVTSLWLAVNKISPHQGTEVPNPDVNKSNITAGPIICHIIKLCAAGSSIDMYNNDV